MEFRIKEKYLAEIFKGASATGRDEGVMRIKEDRWFLASQSPSDVLMFASQVPESEMEGWDPGDQKALGIEYKKPKKFLSSRDSMIHVEFYETDAGVHKLRFNKGGSTLEVPLVDIDLVDGKVSDIPQLPWVAELHGDLTFLKDFVKDSGNIIGSSSYMVGCRPGALFLYTAHDDTRKWDKYNLEDFEDASLNWSNGHQEKQAFNNPEEDKAIDTILSTEWSSNIHYLSDEGSIYMNNHMPVKMVFDMDSDIKASYFISPRIPDNDNKATIPDDVLKGRGME